MTTHATLAILGAIAIVFGGIALYAIGVLLYELHGRKPRYKRRTR